MKFSSVARTGLIFGTLAAAGCMQTDVNEASGTIGSGLAGSAPLHGASGKCLDVTGGSTESGAKIQLWSCNGNSWQQWSHDNGALVSPSGKCLDVTWGDPSSGTPVQLWDCNGTDAQKWVAKGNTFVGLAGKCLDVRGGASADGTPVQLWDCNGTDAQKWSFDAATAPSSPAVGGGSSDLQAARAFLQPLRLGFNIERSWAWSIPGGPRSNAEYLRGLGVTHVRLFYPWSPRTNYGVNPGDPGSHMRDYLDAIGQYIGAGLTVLADCTDILDENDFNVSHDAIYQEVRDMARLAATYDFPRDKFSLGAVNEMAGEGDNGSDPFVRPRNELHDIIREALPGYVITVASAYWGDYRRLVNMEPLGDQRVIYSTHVYASWSSQEEWTRAVADPLNEWSRQHGRLPILLGEFGPYGEEWASWSTKIIPSMAVFRPTFWTITYGSLLRLNNSGDDARLNGEVTDFLSRAVPAANAALQGNDGAP